MTVTLLIIGAGGRGKRYANFARDHRDICTIAGVADLRPMRRNRIAADFGLAEDAVAIDWHEFASRPRFADAAVICLLDRFHLEAVKTFATLGYHILCEKPIAVSIPECIEIAREIRQANVIFGVCHVLRYSPYNQAIKAALDSGTIGDIVNIQHIEPVGSEHFAHSYVRGNWRNESDSSFSLMTKCCHDLDVLNFYLSGKDGSDKLRNRPQSVSSFGSLFHFRPEKKPAAANGATRCLQCPIEADCAYSAKKIYLDHYYRPDVATRETKARHFVESEILTPDTILPVLETSRYGECVYNGANDVNDHQVVNIQYQSGATASMTMVAFTDTHSECDRITRIHGTRGQLIGNMKTFDVYDFVGKTTQTFTPRQEGGGHGGGDAGVGRAFVAAVAAKDQSKMGVNPEDILMSHLLVFAAEEARKSRTVVDFGDFCAKHMC